MLRACSTRSIQVPAKRADRTPAGMPRQTAIKVAITTICAVYGNRRPMSLMTGLPVRSEVPRSSVATSPAQSPNWTTSGRSSPILLRTCASSSSETTPAPAPLSITAASPGMTRMMTNTITATPNRVTMPMTKRWRMKLNIRPRTGRAAQASSQTLSICMLA